MPHSTKPLTTPRDDEPARTRWRWLVYALPVAAVGLLVAIFAVSPQFYLATVLAHDTREEQVVEIVTLASALTATVLLIGATIGLWRLRRVQPTRGAAMIVAVLALAALFFAGEEASWGQDFFKWKTPEALREHTPQTNLHNMDTLPIRVKPVGNLFLIGMFFILPAVWHLDRDRRLPRDWAAAIPEGPVVFCMAVAFTWRLSKKLYQAVFADWETDPDAHPWYWGFFEEIAEHKEMLVAVALLIYGIYRVRWVRKARRHAGTKAPRVGP